MAKAKVMICLYLGRQRNRSQVPWGQHIILRKLTCAAPASLHPDDTRHLRGTFAGLKNPEV